MNLRRVSVFVAAAFLSAAPALPSRAQDAEIAKMTDELLRLSAEQKQIPTKLQANLALKEQIEQLSKKAADERTALKAELAAIEVQRRTVRKLCSGKVPISQLAAARERCDHVLQPFNRRTDAYNVRNNQNVAAGQLLQQKEIARTAEQAELEARSVQISQRITALQAAIRTRQAAVQRVEQNQKPASGATQPTAAQAIEENFGSVKGDASAKQNPATQTAEQQPSATTARTPKQTVEEHFKVILSGSMTSKQF